MTQHQLYIMAERTCDYCAGAGVVEHPAWRSYVGEHAGLLAPDEEENWWLERGYGPDELPPQEGTCPDCDGSGRVVWRVTVEELAALVRPWLAGEVTP